MHPLHAGSDGQARPNGRRRTEIAVPMAGRRPGIDQLRAPFTIFERRQPGPRFRPQV